MQHKTMVKKAKWALKHNIVRNGKRDMLEDLIASPVLLVGERLETVIEILKEEEGKWK